MKREVKKSKDRVEIIYRNDDDEIVAHESLSKETYEKNYPKENE